MTIYSRKFEIHEPNNYKTLNNDRYEPNIQNNQYYNHNSRSNQKYTIFDNMKIDKTAKIIEESNNNNLYKSQNINTQINNYFNTKNTNYYFNKLNTFNSLIIEKQRPTYCPKNPKKENKIENNDISLNNNSKNIFKNINKPKI